MSAAPSRLASRSRLELVLLSAVIAVAAVAVVGALGIPGAVAPGHAALPRTLSSSGWANATSGASPPGLAIGGSLAFDSADGYLVLFGGCLSGNYWYSDCVPSNQTWIYQNGTWSQLHPLVSPPARYLSNLVYDGQENDLVLFGGNGTSSFLNDTWTFSAGQWTPQFPANSPPARAGAGMVYDAADHYVLLTDGEQFRTLTDLSTETYVGADFNDSWTYSAGNWQQLHPTDNPSARDAFGMTYDASLGSVVLFGGFNWTSYNQGDTWLFSGGSWTPVASSMGNGSYYAPSPAGRNNPAFAYDPSIGADVLFGGHDGYSIYGDTWQFNGTAWNAVSPPSAPSARFAAGLAYDPSMGCLVLYGGYIPNPSTAWVPGFQLNDTWTYGCNGTGGTGNSSGGNGSSGNGSSGNGSGGNSSGGNSSGGNGSSGNGSSGGGSSSGSSGNNSSGNNSGGSPGGSTGGPTPSHAPTGRPAVPAHASRPSVSGPAPLTAGAGAAPAPSGSGVWISPVGFLLYFVLSTGLLVFVVVARRQRPPARR